ncbi:uncharacterized protein PAC_16831 [Phialocephala subalpina]|uniref:Uncharacterized protein n=1 Tax=Phialocephala subalpina TaxID=576137 RepID=A0A1L7XPF7_9HELO|nr:uncharacterized protein PAC_16831 [Phialocephala subalpina]
MENFLKGIDKETAEKICGTETVTELQKSTREKIEKASAILQSCKAGGAQKEVKAGKFVLKKNQVQEILQKLKDAGLYSMTMMLTMLMNAMSERLTDKIQGLLSSEDFCAKLRAIVISATESSTQQSATMSASFAVVESSKSRSGGSTGVGNRQSNISKPTSASTRLAFRHSTGNGAPSRAHSIRSKVSQTFSWVHTNTSKKHLCLALDDAAPAMNRSPIEEQNAKVASTATGETPCSQPPALEEPAISLASTTSKPQQIPPPAVVSDGIATLNPESSDEIKPAVNLGDKSPESQESVVESRDVSSQEAPSGTEEQLKPGPIQVPVSNPATPQSRHDASPVSIQSSDPWTWTLPKKRSQKKSYPRPADLLEAFGRICTRQSLPIRNKQPQPGRPFFSTGTHMNIAVLDDAPWGFLFFQRPDNWIQPALIPRDSSQKAILLQPLVEATKDSPLWCDIDENVSKSTLRLFFSYDCRSRSLLSEVKIEFGEYGQISWSVIPLRQTFPGDLGFLKFLYGMWDQGKIVLTCVTSSQVLVRYREQEDGSWLPITYPCEIPASPGDFIYDSTSLHGSELRVRTLNQTEINLYAVRGVLNLVDISSSKAEDMETEAQAMDWHGIQPDSESFSCQLIRCVNSVDGVIYKAADNEIYLRRGNPWCYDEGDEADAAVVPGPERICTTKAGSEFVAFESWRELLYFSEEGEMMRIEFAVDESGEEITFGDPSSVFSEDWSQASLDDLLLPGPLDHYLIQSGRGRTKASESDLESSYYTGTSVSSASSDRRTRESRLSRNRCTPDRRPSRNPSVDSRVMRPTRGSSIDSLNRS